MSPAPPGPGGRCVGRFAPSPTGPLHAGSLVAALASWLDVRARGGTWLLRIEDVDRPRCLPGAAERILAQLAACGLRPDAPPVWQSSRGPAYAAALAQLLAAGWAYRCRCSRRDVDAALAALGRTHQRFGERVYPGTCRPRPGPAGAHPTDPADRADLAARVPCATRLLTVQRDPATGAETDIVIDWCDRRLGPQRQALSREVGDFVLQRADGLWAYQLAVVVDDGAQGVTDVVRGADLCDNTARQIHLQRLLGLPQPRHLHLPLVLGADGHKLSKQNGAAALDTAAPLAALAAAGLALGLPPIAAATVGDWLALAVQAWPAACAAWPAAPQWHDAGPLSNASTGSPR